MLTNEEILEQIFDEGFVIYPIEVTPKLTVKLKSLSAEDYLSIDQKLLDQKGTRMYIMQLYALYKLALSLYQYKTTTFSNFDEAVAFLKSKSAIILDKLLQEQNKFEKKLKDILSIDTIDKNFFVQDDLLEKPEQSPKV